jgi:hypothetical protein
VLLEFGDGSFEPADVEKDAAIRFILSEDLESMHSCLFHFVAIFDSGHVGNHHRFH